MSRPKPRVIQSQQITDTTTWEIIETGQGFIITYQGEPVGVRSVTRHLGHDVLKYKKLSYTNLGNCLAQVRKLNAIFKTDQFGYKSI